MPPRTANSAADRTFFSNLFSSIVEEMGVALARTAFSPNIKERRDFSCALFDATGGLIAQAAHIPVHLGAMPMSVEAARARFPEMGRGDVVILNDPYAGGTHLPDITLVSPVFAGRGRAPFAFLATRAHHADVGGMSPGSLPVSREIFQEGFRIPPLLLLERGVLNETLLALLLANVRTPEERRGDLRAQLAAHALGERRVGGAVERYGRGALVRQFGDLLQYGEDAMRALIARIPDGEYRFEDRLDGDGINPNAIPIRACVRISGSGATVDFTGSGAECAGSLNAVEAVTRSAVYYCFLCLAATPSALHDSPPVDPPLNAGSLRPIRVIAPEGTIVNARPPRAVAGGNVETSQRIVDVVFGALAAALPGVIPAASQGTMNNVTIGGHNESLGQPFAYYETTGGGMGASPGSAGDSAVQVHMTNTLNTPAEALEYAYPLRLTRCEVRQGSGGAGARAGGDGIVRELEALGPCTATLLTERRHSAPYGLAGGGDGQPGRNTLVRNGEEVMIEDKVTLELQPGDRLRLETPGGGGYGAA